MIIHLNPQDRFVFHSAVAAQDIQLLLNDLNSQFYYHTPLSLGTSVFGAWLTNPISMGSGDYSLPYHLIEFETSLLQDPSIVFKAFTVNDGFTIGIIHKGSCFDQGNLAMEFDRNLTLKSFGIYYNAFTQSHINTRRLLMNAAFMDLPTILGYIVDTNSRNRTSFTLGDPRQYTVQDKHDADSVQNLGDILQVTNPRDNPTGITKRPHERAGHTRQLSDGRIIDVQPTTVHRDDYEPDDRPKTLKH